MENLNRLKPGELAKFFSVQDDSWRERLLSQLEGPDYHPAAPLVRAVEDARFDVNIIFAPLERYVFADHTQEAQKAREMAEQEKKLVRACELLTQARQALADDYADSGDFGIDLQAAGRREWLAEKIDDSLPIFRQQQEAYRRASSQRGALRPEHWVVFLHFLVRYVNGVAGDKTVAALLRAGYAARGLNEPWTPEQVRKVVDRYQKGKAAEYEGIRALFFPEPETRKSEAEIEAEEDQWLEAQREAEREIIEPASREIQDVMHTHDDRAREHGRNTAAADVIPS